MADINVKDLIADGELFVRSGGDIDGKPVTDFAAGREGTGSPEGVVTAPVGTVYRDTAGTTGAVLWVKASGAGNTGWRVVWGDTGWRNITPGSLPSGIVSGQVHLRRRGDDVYVRVYQVMWASQTAPNNIFGSGISIGAGFNPVDGFQRPLMSVADADLLTQDWLMPYVSSTTLFLRFLYRESAAGNTGTIPASTKHSTGLCVWPTDNPWPSSLPGTAV